MKLMPTVAAMYVCLYYVSFIFCLYFIVEPILYLLFFFTSYISYSCQLLRYTLINNLFKNILTYLIQEYQYNIEKYINLNYRLINGIKVGNFF